MFEDSLEIVFEDSDLVVANKPSGVLCEGGGLRERDLEQRVAERTGRSVRCCHRLDRLTSGLVVLRKTSRYNAALARAFERREVRKEYWALVAGAWDRKTTRAESNIGPVGGGTWANLETGGKSAVSTFQVLGTLEDETVSWVRVLLKTGRTHQARLHCQLLGFPILGDLRYGGPSTGDLFGLHARCLRLLHPGTGAPMELIAQPPATWSALLERFACSGAK